MLGLEKANSPQVHKIILSATAKLKVVKHLIRIRPQRLPREHPTEEDTPGLPQEHGGLSSQCRGI